jgi:hypothetical protein
MGVVCVRTLGMEDTPVLEPLSFARAVHPEIINPAMLPV